MPVLPCPITGCDFKTGDVEMAGAVAILNIHATIHPPATAPPTASRKGPKLERPKVKMNINSEEWNAFMRRWSTFKTGSDISEGAAVGQLLECTSEELGDIVLRAYPDFTSKPIEDAIRLLKGLAVVPVALGVIRSELTAMRQDPEEPFRTFAARVQGKAETCEFKTTYSGSCMNCETQYSGETYYTEESIRDALLNGIADLEIRREAVSADGIQKRPITDIIAFVETREMACNANPTIGVSAVSSYRKNNKSQLPERKGFPSDAEKAKTEACPDCGETFHVFSHKLRGWNKRPHERCEECWKKNRARFRNSGVAGAISTGPDQLGQISAFKKHADKGEVLKLSHHIFSKGQWRRAHLKDHPHVTLSIAPCKS